MTSHNMQTTSNDTLVTIAFQLGNNRSLLDSEKTCILACYLLEGTVNTETSSILAGFGWNGEQFTSPVDFDSLVTALSPPSPPAARLHSPRHLDQTITGQQKVATTNAVAPASAYLRKMKSIKSVSGFYEYLNRIGRYKRGFVFPDKFTREFLPESVKHLDVISRARFSDCIKTLTYPLETPDGI